MNRSSNLPDTIRSSPRSQTRKAANKAPAESLHSAAQTPTQLKKAQVNRPNQRSDAGIEEASPSKGKTGTSKDSRKEPKIEQGKENGQKVDFAPTTTPKSSRQKRKAGNTEEDAILEGTTPQSSKRWKATKIEREKLADISPPPKRSKPEKTKEIKEEEASSAAVSPSKTKRKIKAKKEGKEGKEQGEVDDNEAPKKTRRPRKTKEEKEAEAMPLATRTPNLRLYIGSHVSSAKGVQNSITNAVHIGANALALFLKSQRKWDNPPLAPSHRDQFISACASHGYDPGAHILPHGSYLVNLAQADPTKATQAYNGFIDDLHRCEALGIRLYNFHPGSTGPFPRPSAIARIAAALNRAHAETSTVIPVLETMAGAGNVIGSTFEDLRDIIALVEQKERIGVCLDTCHVFAAGYDIRSPAAFEATMSNFDKVVGLRYLRALHLNDSKAPLGSHRDLHQNIGLGFLGLRAFHNIVNYAPFSNLPMVLETPIDTTDPDGKEIEDKGIWAREIKMLEGMVGVNAEGSAFRVMEGELAGRGEVEREKGGRRERGQRKLGWGKGGGGGGSEDSVGD